MTGAIAGGLPLIADMDEIFGWKHAHKPSV